MTERVHVGPADAIGPGVVQTVRLAPDASGRPRRAIVVRTPDGSLRAYSNVCKHIPIPLDSFSGDFLETYEDRVYLRCLTHGALYQLEDGLCILGPCDGDSLDRFDLEIDGGEVYLIDPRAMP